MKEGNTEFNKYDFVVFIDDDEGVNTFHKIVLNLSGICENAKFFERPEDAVTYFSDLKDTNSTFPEIIFLDINMPRMNGWEFLEKYAELNIVSDTKIVMLSSSLNPEDEDRAASNQLIERFLSKPLSVIHLNEIAGNQVDF
ncbi:MAG: response regulator [Reichenbachiella sp.]